MARENNTRYNFRMSSIAPWSYRRCLEHIKKSKTNSKKMSMAEYVRIAVNFLNQEDLEAARKRYRIDEFEAGEE
jgi:hypothetical protein